MKFLSVVANDEFGILYFETKYDTDEKIQELVDKIEKAK